MSSGPTSSAPRDTSANSLFRAMPFYDAAGRFSAFRTIVLVALCVPAAVVAYQYAAGTLGARPINEAVHQIGNWAIRLIMVSLVITPASRLVQWPVLMQVRRLIGVAAFCYVAAHFALYVADEAFDLGKVATEIVFRIYLTIGFAGLLILTAMAATSTDGMMRRLGGRRWRRLHQAIYLGGLLAVVHFFMQSKANIDEPLVVAGIFLWLMAYRAAAAVRRLRTALRTWLPAALALVAGAAVALGEASYYAIKVGAPIMRILDANLTFALGPRPAVIATGICLALALAGFVRQIPGAVVSPASRQTTPSSP